MYKLRQESCSFTDAFSTRKCANRFNLSERHPTNGPNFILPAPVRVVGYKSKNSKSDKAPCVTMTYVYKLHPVCTRFAALLSRHFCRPMVPFTKPSPNENS